MSDSVIQIRLIYKKPIPQMPSWTQVRQSVLVAVLLSNLLNFTTQWIARKTNDEQISNRIRHTRIFVFIFGLISLFACNLVQGGIFEAIMVWAVFGGLVFMHYINFKAVNEKMRGIARLLVTCLLFGQCLGTIIQYLA